MGRIFYLYITPVTHILFFLLNILLTLYLVTPNYILYGYILLLLCWIIGRQLFERTRRHLWFPLKVYAITVFIFIYSLSNLSTFEMWLSGLIDLQFVEYYEEMGKPTPKVEVMRFLKSKQYTDAKDFAGECESVVVIAKGQGVQGTCKYGTRVDYILASPDCPYNFIPGSYLVLSSKSTSDHHIVKVDVTKCENNSPHESNGNNNKITKKRRRQRKHQAIVKISGTAPPSKGIWTTNTLSKVE